MNLPRFRTTLSKGVIIPSMLFIIAVSLLSAVCPALTNNLDNQLNQFILVTLNWIYVWSVTAFVIFLIYLMVGRYGSITLCRNNSKPAYSFFSWMSMLFAAGMGV